MSLLNRLKRLEVGGKDIERERAVLDQALKGDFTEYRFIFKKYRRNFYHRLLTDTDIPEKRMQTLYHQSLHLLQDYLLKHPNHKFSQGLGTYINLFGFAIASKEVKMKIPRKDLSIMNEVDHGAFYPALKETLDQEEKRMKVMAPNRASIAKGKRNTWLGIGILFLLLTFVVFLLDYLI